MENGQVLKFQVPNDIDYLSVLTAAAKIVAERIGFDDRDVRRIQLAIEEGMTNILEHAFEPDECSSFNLSLEPTEQGLRIVLHDNGLPYAPPEDAAERGEPDSAIGMKLMRGVMDHFAFENLGPGGKSVTMEIHLKTRSAESMVRPAEVAAYQAETSPAVVKRIAREIRLFDTENATEGVDIAQCAYKTYGYGYAYSDIYYPEKLIRMNREGTLVSVVAINAEDGDMMGHAALKLARRGDFVAENAVAFVKPLYRGQEVFGELVAFRLRLAREMGLKALYTQAVTAHPASQKGCLKSGFLESGICVGHFCANEWKGFSLGKKTFRTSCLVGHLYLERPEAVALYLPPRHAEMLHEIYAHHGRRVNYASMPESVAWEDDQSVVEFSANPTTQSAEIYYHAIGRNAVESLRAQMRQLARGGVVNMVLMMPLDSPLTPWFSTEAEKYDFYFSGMRLGSKCRDMLMLQYNACEVDYGTICVVSDFSERLLSYIRKTDPAEV